MLAVGPPDGDPGGKQQWPAGSSSDADWPSGTTPPQANAFNTVYAAVALI